MTTTLGAITPGEEPKRVTITEQATKSGRSLRAAGWLYEENRRLLQERDELVGALRGMDVERMNCRKRVEKDGSLNHGPTCRSTVPNERTDRSDWCHVCHATEILSKYPKP